MLRRMSLPTHSTCNATQRLDKQYHVAENKLEDFRERLRETKLELAAKDRRVLTWLTGAPVKL